MTSGGVSEAKNIQLAWFWQLPFAFFSTVPWPFTTREQIPFRQPLLASSFHDQQSARVAVRSSGAASSLRQALRNVDRDSWRANVLGVVQLGGLLAACGQVLSPKGPGGCDRNRCERCANVITSVPYVAVGAHCLKYRASKEGKLWGASLACVGLASAGFHSSTGRWRSIGRKLDYWSIALSSNLLVRAVFPGTPAPITMAGCLLTPIRPFLVSFLNTAAMEAKYLYQSTKKAELRRPQLIHSACCLAGLSAFALEDLKPQIPCTHACWHCLSAAGIATTIPLLADVEKEFPFNVSKSLVRV